MPALEKLKKYLNILYKSLIKASKDTIRHDGIEHAGYLSFLAILSIFPFLVFFISLAGLLGETSLGHDLVRVFLSHLPREIASAIRPLIREITSGPPQGFLTIAILGAIWTASSSVEGLRTIFNRAYRVSTPPTYILRRLLSIAQFLIITFLILLSIVIIIVLPPAITWLLHFINYNYNPEFLESIFSLGFYLFYIIIFFAISFLYYVIPNLKQKWRNVFPGSILVLFLWYVATSLFSIYLKNFDQVNIIYGSLASFIVTLLFFYSMAMILVFGAEFNYALEKITGFRFVEKISSKKRKKNA